MKALNWAMGLILAGTMGQALAAEESPFGGVGNDGAPVIGKEFNPAGGWVNDGLPFGQVGGDGSPIIVIGGGGLPIIVIGGGLPGFWGPIGGGDLPLPAPGKP